MEENIDSSAPDGGAPYLTWNLDAHNLGERERDLLQSLGAALVTQWADLPRDIQATLFKAAAKGPENLKDHLARFLHDHIGEKH